MKTGDECKEVLGLDVVVHRISHKRTLKMTIILMPYI